jgi:CHAT domain-containing protein
MIKPHIERALRRRPSRADAFRTASLLSLLLVAFAALEVFGGGGFPAFAHLNAPRVASDAAPGEEVQTLLPGEVVRRHMKPGETHAFELKLMAKQFARVVVAQQGADVGVRVSAPGGASSAAEVDSPNGLFGLESISILARVEGSYRVEVYSYQSTPPGDYELKVEGPREAIASDELHVAAERVFGEAQDLRIKAGSLSRAQAVEKYDLAIKKYREALDLWRGLGEVRGEGYSLSGIGRVYKALGQLPQALEHLGQAREHLRDAGDISGQAFVLNETGAAHRDLGDPLQALDCYAPALELRTGLRDQWGQAQLYNNIGLIYSNIGSQPKAIENLEKALLIWRGMGMRAPEMNALVNAAKAHAEMGDVDVALAQYQEVLTFCETEAAKQDSPWKPVAVFLKPFALNGLGLVYDTWAESEQARSNYKQALELFRVNNNSRGEADVLDNLGMAHAFLGDAPQALEHFRAALVIRERLKEPKGWAVTLSNIGYAHTLMEENEEALKHLALALPLSEQSRERRFEAYTLMRMGMAYVAKRRPREALEKYERALAIQNGAEFEDRRGQAMTLDKIGEALALSGDLAEAHRRYVQALERWKAVGDRQGQALSLYGIARVELERHNLANAREQIEEAINIVESLRHKVTGRQLRMTYFAGKQDFYALAIDVRMRLYELTNSAADMEAALSASERARARNLIDLLSEVRADLYRGMSPQDAAKNRRLVQEISALTQTLLRLRSRGEKEAVAVVERKLAAHITEQDELLAPFKKTAVSSNGTNQAQPLTPREIQGLLDEDTLLLQYSLGEERSHLWAVTRKGIEHHFLDSRAEIEEAAKQLRQALTAYEPQRPGESGVEYVTRQRGAPEQYRRSALELSRMLLDRVAPQLGNRRLVIVADGALQYIPFEALPMSAKALPNQSTSNPAAASHPALLSRNEVVYQPSASTLALLRGARRPRPPKTVAVLADPVFDNRDKRVRAPASGQGVALLPKAEGGELARTLRDLGDVGDGAFTLSKLEYSLREANAITAVAPQGSWMKAVGFKANRATAMSPALKQFGIVHFATHGLVNDNHPELSGIVLSLVNERGQPEDGYLSLRDIYNLDLPVDLVVLSACRTGIGKQVRGEGLIGLTRGFMYAGTPRVVASLWRVDDEATAELMKRFYRYMLGSEKMSAAAALRRAKIEMMNASERWRAPYYWAGFVLQGDWK